MAAFFTGSRSSKEGRRPSTEKVFLGRLCERIARAHCRRRGWRVLRANWQLRTGEIDLLAEDRAGRWVIVEVRGYHPGGREPARVLSQAKQRRLRALAQYLGARYRRAVRIELVEVTGRAPRTRWARALWWLAARWHAPGFRCRAREL